MEGQELAPKESVLPARVLPLPDDDSNSRVVRVEELYLDSRSDDDDVPIVSTLTLPKHIDITQAQTMSRVVRVEDLYLDSRSDDDDVPIVSTLKLPKPKRKVRPKAPVKWSYETVSEPTGAASKYWDAGAPSERATKRLAKEKMVAINAGYEENEDYTPRADETDVPNPPRKRKKQATKQNGRSRTCTLLFEPIAIINILSYMKRRKMKKVTRN